MGAIGFVVTHFGNRYVVAPEMAEIFMRRRQRLLDAGQAELVPLPHTGGVDILWVDATVPCEVKPIMVTDGDDPEDARRRWGLCRRNRLSASGEAGPSATRATGEATEVSG
jgi:hypothetical protein